MNLDITLRHLNHDDYAAIRDYVCNPKVAKYLTWQVYTQGKEVESYFKKILVKVASPDEVLGIEYKKKIVGSVHLILRQSKFIQMGFGIIPNLWHQGIGTETLRIILGYIQNTDWSQISKEIWADIHKDNIYAAKTLQKNGFNLEVVGEELNRNRFILRLS